VFDLQTLVSAEPSLSHYYTFEGMTTADRLKDKVAGGAGLSVVAYGTGSTTIGAANGVRFDGPSFDGQTTALMSYNNGLGMGSGGAGLSTVASIALPTTLTVEAIVRPLAAPLEEGYGVSTRAAANNRGYFIAQPNGTNNLITAIGDNYAASSRNLVTSYTPGQWYYVANTYTISGGNTTVNGYVANLSKREALTQVVNNVTVTGTYGASSPLAIGLADFTPAGYSLQRAFQGQLDEVALYNTALSQSTIAQHLQQLRKFTLANPSFEMITGTQTSSGSYSDPIMAWGESAGSANSAVQELPFNEGTGWINPPASDGRHAAILVLRDGSVTNTWLYQSLGIIDGDDLGKVFKLDADVAARTNMTYLNGAAQIAFATGVSGSSLGVNVGSQLASAADSQVLVGEGFHTLTEAIRIPESLLGQELFVRLSVSDTTPASGSAQYYFDNLRLVQVPEPASLALLGLGVAVLMAGRTRRRDAAR
jgi:hypothetical protein